MSNLLRALLLRQNLLMRPADDEGSTAGGAAGAGHVDDDEDDGADDEPGADGGDSDDDGDGADDEDAEIVVTLGAAAEPTDEDEEEAIAEALADTPTNAAFAKIRKAKQDLKRQNAAKDQRIRELEAKQAASAPAVQEIVVGPEPDPKDYEMWEADQAAKFKADLLAWTSKKSEAENVQRERTKAAEAQQKHWVDRCASVDAAAVGLKLKGVEEANETLATVLSPVQFGILTGGPEDPKDAALLRYAIGKNPAVAKKLAAIQDPVRYTFELARLLFKELNVSNRKTTTTPPPEKRLRPGVAGAAGTGDQVDRLRAEADKTGDRSKVVAALRAKNRQTA